MNKSVYSSIALSLILGLMMQFIISCASTVKRMPDFEHFKLYGETRKDPDAPLGHVHALTDMKFTPDEFEKIMNRNVSDELIGAGVQAYSSNTIALEALRQATRKAPSNPVAWAALVGQEVDSLSRKHMNVSFDDVYKDIEEFERVDTDNALPVFLKAAVYFYEGRQQEARSALLLTSEKSAFRTYDIEKKKCIIRAAEQVGFSDFSARYYAFVHQDIPSLNTYVRDIFEVFKEDREVANAVYEIGIKMEPQSKSNLALMVAYLFQGYANDTLGNEEVEKDLIEKDEAMKNRPRLALEDPFKVIPEKRWIKYFDEAFEINEQVAYKKLYSEYSTVTNQTKQ